MAKPKTTKEVKESKEASKVRKNWTKIFAIVQAGIIWTAIVLAIGFFIGQNYANNKYESVKAEAKSIVSSLN